MAAGALIIVVVDLFIVTPITLLAIAQPELLPVAAVVDVTIGLPATIYGLSLILEGLSENNDSSIPQLPTSAPESGQANPFETRISPEPATSTSGSPSSISSGGWNGWYYPPVTTSESAIDIAHSSISIGSGGWDAWCWCRWYIGKLDELINNEDYQ